jgi:hypothetical protein
MRLSKLASVYYSAVFVLVAFCLSGCGFRVPEIQDNGDHVEAQRFIQEVQTNILCQLRAAFSDLRDTVGHTFLDDWGVQTTLTLKYDAVTTFSPAVVGTPAPHIGIF